MQRPTEGIPYSICNVVIFNVISSTAVALCFLFGILDSQDFQPSQRYDPYGMNNEVFPMPFLAGRVIFILLMILSALTHIIGVLITLKADPIGWQCIAYNTVWFCYGVCSFAILTEKVWITVICAILSIPFHFYLIPKRDIALLEVGIHYVFLGSVSLAIYCGIMLDIGSWDYYGPMIISSLEASRSLGQTRGYVTVEWGSSWGCPMMPENTWCTDTFPVNPCHRMCNTYFENECSESTLLECLHSEYNEVDINTIDRNQVPWDEDSNNTAEWANQNFFGDCTACRAEEEPTPEGRPVSLVKAAKTFGVPIVIIGTCVIGIAMVAIVWITHKEFSGSASSLCNTESQHEHEKSEVPPVLK
jgi:hypothetical protein